MSDIDHSIKLSERIEMWASDLRLEGDTGLTTLDMIQGIQQEVSELESKLTKIQELPEKWRRKSDVLNDLGESTQLSKAEGLEKCADELERVLPN